MYNYISNIYFFLMRILCLHTVIGLQVFLSNITTTTTIIIIIIIIESCQLLLSVPTDHRSKQVFLTASSVRTKM